MSERNTYTLLLVFDGGATSVVAPVSKCVYDDLRHKGPFEGRSVGMDNYLLIALGVPCHQPGLFDRLLSEVRG